MKCKRLNEESQSREKRGGFCRHRRRLQCKADAEFL